MRKVYLLVLLLFTITGLLSISVQADTDATLWTNDPSGVCRDNNGKYPRWSDYNWTLSQCEKACKGNNNCQGFAMHKEKNYCQLFGSDGKNNASQPGTQITRGDSSHPEYTCHIKSIIQDTKSGCCGGSMSGANVCVNATIKNFSSSPMTYSTRYIGLKSGNCVKYDDNYCAQHPPASGMICVPPCVEISSPTIVTTMGPSVSVPAKGTANVHIVAPNHKYIAGSVIEVQPTDGAPSRAHVPPINQCVL